MQDDSHAYSSHLAQRRVRWLSIAGVGSGALLFCVATILLVWTHSIREHTKEIEYRLFESRLLVGRALIDIHHDWDRLIGELDRDAPDTHWPEVPAWKDELQAATEKCVELNSLPALQSQGREVSISSDSLLSCYQQVIDWNQRNRQVLGLVQTRLDDVDSHLHRLLREIDRQHGINRLQFAVALRDSLANGESRIGNVLDDCAQDALLSRLRGDLNELRLYLFRLVNSRDRNELVDLSENQIRPLINRLNSAIEDERLSEVFKQVVRLILQLPDVHGSDSIASAGLSHLQLVFAELLDEHRLLLAQATAAVDNLSDEHARLAVVSGALQNSLNARLARALAIVWSIVLAIGLGLSLVFLMLTRRVSRDIALQVEAIGLSASELAKEQSLLATVISSLPNPLFWKDKNGRYLGCSQSFAKWLGVQNASEIIGKTDAELLWSGDTAERKNRVESEVIETAKSFNDEVIKTLQDGRRCVVLASKAPLRSAEGEVSGILGAYIDITERKVMEERATGLAKIMAECPTEIYVFDIDTLKLIELNRAACTSSGFDRDFYRSYSFADINQLFNSNSLKTALKPLLDGTRQQLDYETLHRRCDGSAYPVHVSVMCTELGGEQVFVACATDLTEYKQLEMKLAQAQKLESIGQLAAGIAHEINTPMQCISGNIEFLQNCSGKLMDVVDALQSQMYSQPAEWEQRVEALKELMLENRYEYVRRQFPLAISESSQAAARVVEIVRAMKVMSHPGTREKVTTDLNGLIRDAATVSRNRWKDGADIDFQLDQDLPTIEALPAELSQVMLNLLVNAADAIVEKNGENAAQKGRIVVQTCYDADSIYLIVSDNGAGMPEHVKQRVFEPFFTTKEVGKGTGQGLSIVYDVVTKMHGGSIEIETKVGVGTAFTLRMPRAIPRAPGVESHSQFVVVSA